MEYYKPEIIESFKELVATGRVELLAESYAHSITSVYDLTEWRAQIAMQKKPSSGNYLGSSLASSVILNSSTTMKSPTKQ